MLLLPTLLLPKLLLPLLLLPMFFLASAVQADLPLGTHSNPTMTLQVEAVQVW